MERFIKTCLRYPTLTAVLTLMVVAVGIRSLMGMPRTEDPSITIRTGIVAAAYPGATSEQVEKQVTKTLEANILKFQEVRKNKTYSTSRPGVVIINVELENNVKNPDVFWSKLRHELNVVKATSLPPQVMGPVVNSDFGDTVSLTRFWGRTCRSIPRGYGMLRAVSSGKLWGTGRPRWHRRQHGYNLSLAVRSFTTAPASRSD